MATVNFVGETKLWSLAGEGLDLMKELDQAPSMISCQYSVVSVCRLDRSGAEARPDEGADEAVAKRVLPLNAPTPP